VQQRGGARAVSSLPAPHRDAARSGAQGHQRAGHGQRQRGADRSYAAVGADRLRDKCLARHVWLHDAAGDGAEPAPHAGGGHRQRDRVLDAQGADSQAAVQGPHHQLPWVQPRAVLELPLGTCHSAVARSLLVAAKLLLGIAALPLALLTQALGGHAARGGTAIATRSAIDPCIPPWATAQLCPLA
jgi:hypothetical protein